MEKCDIKKTQIIGNLLAVAREKRDGAWSKEFLDAVATASFAIGEPQVFMGPDGFPYLDLRMPEPSKPFQAHSIALAAEQLVEQGIGVAINPHPGPPVWVFSYGDIWSYLKFGALNVPVEKNIPGVTPPNSQPGHKQETVKESRSVLVGSPSEEYLPTPVRNLLAAYMKSVLGIKVPMVLLIDDPATNPSQSIMLNYFVESVSNKADYDRNMQRLCWFFPRHYILTGASSETFKDSPWTELEAKPKSSAG